MTDFWDDQHGDVARAVFSGLAPQSRPAQPDARISRGSNPTMPIILVSTMTMSLTGAIAIVDAQPKPEHRPDPSSARGSARLASASAAAMVTLAAPNTYKVVSGDTVGKIAARYGLSTARILALNGLSPTSLIFPGQVLKLTAAGAVAPVAAVQIAAVTATRSTYTIKKGDTISGIAKKYGVTAQAILAANKLGWSSIIYPGQALTIPGASAIQTIDAVTVSSVTPTAPAPAAGGTYVIKAGDTISKIAAKFGLSVQAILDANGLTKGSIIYAGRALVIPGAVAAAAPTGTAGTITLLNAEQSANASTIISVGRNLGVPEYGIIIALATAMQESSLRNLNYGHLDSVGLFQQRPSAHWGTVAQLTDPTYAARLFYGGPSNPNKGITRGLLEVSGWQSLTLTQAAQKVQVSAFPDAYAKWETSARYWYSQLG